MKKTLFSLVVLLTLCSFIERISPKLPLADMTLCKTGHNGQVQAGDLYRKGSIIGSIISVNRTSKNVKAKYIAYKASGATVHERYDAWRKGKTPVLVSSGAYSTSFEDNGIPVGFTIDDGNLVNSSFESKMDGLIIVENIGGVRISNIEDGNLKINVNGKFETIDIRNGLHRSRFLDWCKKEQATVFQTHLLIYDNKTKVSSNASSSKAIRRLLVMAKDANGQLFHMILYPKQWSATLAETADYTLNLLNSKGYQVLSAINLDTGRIDVLATSTELSDCKGNAITGESNLQRQKISNMLVYYTE